MLCILWKNPVGGFRKGLIIKEALLLFRLSFGIRIKLSLKFF